MRDRRRSDALAAAILSLVFYAPLAGQTDARPSEWMNVHVEFTEAVPRNPKDKIEIEKTRLDIEEMLKRGGPSGI